jgi:glycosyltransferase involved in cell wall biosynthesis
MKVAIDLNGALGHRGGIRTYVQQLVDHFQTLETPLQLALYAAYWNGYPDKTDAIVSPDASYERIFKRFPQRYLEKLESLSRLRLQETILHRHHINLFHATSHVLPLMKRIKTLLTVHHENPRSFAMNAQELENIDRAEQSARRADHIIAVSRHTENYLVHTLKIPAEKISVIYHGAPEIDLARRDKAKSLERLTKIYGVRPPYFLCVAHVNKRKNIQGLLQAHALFLKRPQTKTPLVIIGHADSLYAQEIKKTLAGMPQEKYVLFTGELPHETVIDFYLNAYLFIFPTFIESFGIPVIEAMKCGCPVIASDVDAVPEILGEAGILVSPQNPEAIADAMYRVWINEDLRRKLIDNGLARARLFSWQKTTQETLALYQRILHV